MTLMPRVQIEEADLPPLHERLDRRAVSLMVVVALLLSGLWYEAAPARATPPSSITPSSAVHEQSAHATAPPASHTGAAAGTPIHAPAAVPGKASAPSGTAPEGLSPATRIRGAGEVGPRLEPRPAPQSPPPPLMLTAAGAKPASPPRHLARAPLPLAAPQAGEAAALAAAAAISAPLVVPPDPDPGTEIVSARTASSRTYLNRDGTRTATLGTNLNYRTPSGTWEPVDLGFRPWGAVPGQGFIEDRSAVAVRISPRSIDTTDAGGAGLRLITPAMAPVSGTVATLAAQGLNWTYRASGSGMVFSSVVVQPQGPRNYVFPYQLLGGARALAVDDDGNLVSDVFRITRATVVGSNGHVYRASGWRVLAGNVASFSFDDSALPAAGALPYLIDPYIEFSRNSAASASFGVSGPGYPPGGGVTTYPSNNWLLVADSNKGSGQYAVADAAMTFDTSSIPSTAVPVLVFGTFHSCYVSNPDGASMQLYADWISGQPLTAALYPPSSATPNALNGGQGIPPGAADPIGCINGTAGGPGVFLIGPNGLNGAPLNTGSGFSPGGSTSLRLHVANRSNWPSSPAPAGDNFMFFAGQSNPQNAAPGLVVRYILPVNPPTAVTPAPGATVNTLTPSLWAATTDPDGDAVNWYGYGVVESGGHAVWAVQWFNVYGPEAVPGGLLAWNQSYSWVGCGWDGSDPFAVYPAGGVTCSYFPFNTNTLALPTPSLVSPAPGAFLATATPLLTAGSVSDPNPGGTISYHFSVSTNADGTGVVADSGAVPSTSWTVPAALGDGTYYWRVRAQDNFNSPSSWAATRAMIVDAAPPPAPSVTFTVAQPALAVRSHSVSVSWSDADESGIAGYAYSTALDQNPSFTPAPSSAGTATSVTVTAASDGQWYFHIRAENRAGVWGPATNFPILVAAGSAGDPVGCTTSACTAYSDATGLEGFYPYTPFNLGTGSASANMATGNLVAQYADVNVAGHGLNLRLTRTYNATLDGVDGPLGRGWTLGVVDGSDAVGNALGALTSLNLAGVIDDLGHSDEFRFTDADGTQHVFWSDGTTWHSPLGVNLVLTSAFDVLNGTVYTLTRPDGVAYTIQLVGLAYRLTQITDRAANKLCFNYSSTPCAPSPLVLGVLLGLLSGNPNALTSPQLQSVTDNLGRAINLSWSGPYLQKVDFRASLTSPVLSTTYAVDATAHRLTAVTEADATASQRTTRFGYAPGAGFGLAQVTDTVGNATAFSYAPTQTVVQMGPTGATTTTTPALGVITDRASKPWTFTYGGPSCQPTATGSAICLSDPDTPPNTTVWTSSPSLNLVAKRDAGDVDTSSHPRYNQVTYGWATNRLVTATDQAGSLTSYAYNGLGQITQTVFAGTGDPPLTTNLFYQTSTASTAVADLVEEDVGAGTAQVRKSLFVPNPDGTLASETQPGSNSGPATTTFGYYPGSGGLLKSVTDPLTNTTTYGYVTGTAANSYGYDPSGQPLEITDALGHAQTFGYDFLGHLLTRTDRTNQTWQGFSDPFGHVTQTVAPAGETTFACYDTNGDQTVAVAAGSPATAANACASTDAFTTRSYYDPRGLLASSLGTVDGQLSKTSYAYYPNGALRNVIEPRSYDAGGVLLTDPTRIAEVTATYYPDSRMASATNEVGAVASATYTPTGWPAVVTAPAHNAAGARTSTTTTYNGRGQVRTTQVSGVAAPTINAYDIFGEVTATTSPNGDTTTFSYWPSGLRHTTTMPPTASDPLPTVATTNYDAAGNVSSLVQPTGIQASTAVTYTSSALNQIQAETDPADPAHLVRFAYDSEARQSARYDLYNGVTETTRASAYDADGRLVSSTASSTTGAPTFGTTMVYDASGRMNAAASTLGGRAVSSISTVYTPEGLAKTMAETITPPAGLGSAVTRSSVFAYLNDGSLAARGFDGATTTYGYDLAGREVTTSPSTGGTFASAYFPSGQLKTETLPNGAVDTQAYDLAGRLSSRTATTAGGTLLSSWTGIGYDANSNRVSQTVTQQTAVALSVLGITLPANIVATSTYTGPVSWGYDAQNRLISFQGPVDAGRTSYVLDDAGNVRSDATTASPTTPTA